MQLRHSLRQRLGECQVGKEAHDLKILFIGDIVGNLGLKVLADCLPVIREQYQPDLIIANGENVAPGGRGITKQAFQLLQKQRIDVVTMGNHVWDHNDIYDILLHPGNLLVRPGNYPNELPGNGVVTIKVGMKNVSVVNLCGQTFMNPINCPFQRIDEILCEIPENHYILLDFHAEASSEKLAMAHYLKGRVTAVVGTHTHIQTNDPQIFADHTAYITDAGMTGSSSGILGMEAQAVIKRFRSKLPVKLQIEDQAEQWQFSAVLIETDNKSTRALKITPIHELSS